MAYNMKHACVISLSSYQSFISDSKSTMLKIGVNIEIVRSMEKMFHVIISFYFAMLFVGLQVLWTLFVLYDTKFNCV